MSGRKPRVAVWRDALCESGLGSTPKLVGLTLSTFMNGAGLAWPARATIASRASLSDRAVDAAVTELERASFLEVERGGGRSKSSRYVITLPETANEVRRIEWETANEVRRSRGIKGEPHDVKGEPHDTNSERGSPESAESAESVAAPFKGAPLIEDNCLLCGTRFVGDGTAAVCDDCSLPELM